MVVNRVVKLLVQTLHRRCCNALASKEQNRAGLRFWLSHAWLRPQGSGNDGDKGTDSRRAVLKAINSLLLIQHPCSGIVHAKQCLIGRRQKHHFESCDGLERA